MLDRVSATTSPEAQRPLFVVPGGQSDGSARFGMLPPDDVFQKRIAENHQLKMSGFFRRGDRKGINLMFKDVAKALTETAQGTPAGQPIKLFYTGVGNGEEPLSQLAVLKAQGRLADAEVHMMDLQGREDFVMNTTLPKGAFGPMAPPEYAKAGFAKRETDGFYEATPDLVEKVRAAADNAGQSRWHTDLQTGLKFVADNSYDVVSCNNVLLYLPDDGAKKTALGHLVRITKSGGRLITDPDPYKRRLLLEAVGEKAVIEEAPGIYRKA